jgi:UDP-glucuronate decarboxylase
MPNFANSWLTNVPLKLYGGGNQTRTFCYITDAIDAFLKILVESKKSGVYNVGNPYPEISMINLAELVKNSIDPNIQIEQIDYPNTYPKTINLRYRLIYRHNTYSKPIQINHEPRS